MSGEWIHFGDMPEVVRILADDGTESVEPLRAPRDGELLVRVLASWNEGHRSPPGAVVEVVAAQDTDELVPGDRLLVFDRAPCGHCEICRRGCAVLCPDAARSLIPSFRRDLLLLPPWIARRGRVRLPQSLGDEAAVQLGRNAWVLRGLKSMLETNPLRILVVGEGDGARVAGLLLETRWPDARRVLLGTVPGSGYHAAVESEAEAIAALGQPADQLIVLSRREVSPGLITPGARVVLCEDAGPGDFSGLWALEAGVKSSRGAVTADVEAWRKHFEAFSMRWESVSKA